MKPKPKLKTTTVETISLSDWNAFVMKVYEKPYHFQQQDGCKDRGMHEFTVPDEETNDEDMPDSIPEVVNGDEMGVKFAVWKARDPKQPITGDGSAQGLWRTELWWHRNFYPCFQTLANDLYARGLLPAGKYTINIDW